MPKDRKKAKKGVGTANAPKQLVATFGKKKVKVGRILKRDNATDTRMQTKKVVLMEQLKSNEKSTILTQRGLNVEDLCRRLGHYNENICREAIIGTKEVFAKYPEQIGKYLRIVMPCIGHLVTNGVKNASTRTHLMGLLGIVLDSSADVFSSHYPLFSSQVLAGFTDARLDVRRFAFEVLTLLMQKFPALCANDRDVFEKYLLQMGGDRIPLKMSAMADSVSLFSSVYSKGGDGGGAAEEATTTDPGWKPQELQISFEDESQKQVGSASLWKELCRRMASEKSPNNGLFWRQMRKLIGKRAGTGGIGN